MPEGKRLSEVWLQIFLLARLLGSKSKFIMENFTTVIWKNLMKT